MDPRTKCLSLPIVATVAAEKLVVATTRSSLSVALQLWLLLDPLL